jgi:hypothetical protein
MKGMARCSSRRDQRIYPSIQHRAHSEDLEMLEIVMPADFSTEEVA